MPPSTSSWDIENEYMADTHYLDQAMVPCAIVSHTWGRWRKIGDGTSLQGMALWHVPENALFEVRELLGVLKKVVFEERYDWLDLLCIPHDRHET